MTKTRFFGFSFVLPEPDRQYSPQWRVEGHEHLLGGCERFKDTGTAIAHLQQFPNSPTNSLSFAEFVGPLSR